MGNFGYRLMNTRSHLVINFLAFQLGWLACVISAARQLPIVGIVVALLVIAWYLYRADQTSRALTLLITVTFIGSLWDSLLTAMGVLVFDTGMVLPYLAPLWIVAMWALFATTLNLSLRWLYGRPLVAMVLGALGGPLAYRAGAELGAVNLPHEWLAMLILAAGWALLMPLLMWIAEYLDQPTRQKVHAHGC